MRANRMSLSCSFVLSRFPNVDFSAFAWYLVDYAVLLTWVSGTLGLISRDLSVVSDLKTVRIPRCGRLRRGVSETSLVYGSTAVDLNSTVSLSRAGFLILVTFCKNDEG